MSYQEEDEITEKNFNIKGKKSKVQPTNDIMNELAKLKSEIRRSHEKNTINTHKSTALKLEEINKRLREIQM